MRITLDNLDGLGAVDYTALVDAAAPLTIQRKLNQPTRCTAGLILDPAGSLTMPVRKARAVVTSDSGATLFTGYLATEPVAVYAGTGTRGPAYRARLTAVSDEWLLDRLGSGATGTTGAILGLDGASLLARLAQRAQAASGAGSTALSVASPAAGARTLGVYSPGSGVAWSANAAAAAGAAYASYRALAGQVTVASAGAVQHALSDADGTLDLAEFSTANLRELANDVTVSGAEEPAAFVQEVFSGDGTTAVFPLTRNAFRVAPETLLDDSFDAAAIDPGLWQLTDGGDHLAPGAGGLVLNGGSGQDGETALSALDVVEMGGTVVAQLGSVLFGAASAGVLAGFYQGSLQLENCFAGFRVRQSVSSTGSVTVVVPVIDGVEVGTVYTPVAGHRYTLRLRLHCPEMQRVLQRYSCMADGVVQTFGQLSGVNAPMDLVFELVDEGVSSNTPATVLYDTAAAGAQVATTPATCTFAVVNALSMFGSVGSVALTRPGSLWVVSTLPNGIRQTRRMGAAGTGADGEATYGSAAGTPGKVTFFAGRIPQPGETVTVSYRSTQRAVARLASAASVLSETAGSIPGTSRWVGKVLAPPARSTADCEAAAEALLAVATSRSAAIGGSLTLTQPAADIWPGDVLAVTSNGQTTTLLVRAVTLQDRHAMPEVLGYTVAFANDWAAEWADGLGLRLSEAIAADASIPETAATTPANVLANLPALAPVALTSSAAQVDAGTAAPPGGGFEVRRRDNAFGPNTSPADLVLRSPVRSFSLPRAAVGERFYIRMYDASTPPLYSRLSAELVLNTPVGV